MVKLAEWIQTNYKEVDRLVRAGVIPPIIKNDFHIFKQYEANRHINSRMQRIENTAEAMGVNPRTVRRAIKRMSSKI